jgi:hypothetical protein
VKYLPLLLATTGAIAIETSAVAEPVTTSVPGSARGQSAHLLTQPASVRQWNLAAPGRVQASPYSNNRQNPTVWSIQAKPQPAKEDSIIPANLIPAELSIPSRSTTVNPIDFFQAPPLDTGVRVKIGRD